MRILLRYRTVAVVTVILLGVGRVCSAAPADECSPDDALAQWQASLERQSKAALELVNKLELRRGQARRLVPLAEQAAELRIEAYQLEATFMPRMAETFAEFAAEDRLNHGFSSEVEHRTAHLNHQVHQARDRIDEQLIELERQVTKILEPAQRELLEDQQPRRHAAENRSRRRSNARHGQDQPAEQRLDEARQELHALHVQIHPRPGQVASHLLHPAAAEQLCKLARVPVPSAVNKALDMLADGTAEHARRDIEEQRAAVNKLRGEINNWNLINGLHMTADQIESIVDAFEDAEDLAATEYGRHKGHARRQTERFALEQKVEAVLNLGQRQVLAEYKACLIPPKNLKNPVLAGQAADDSRYEEWLERARKMPRPQLNKFINASLERESDHFGPLNKGERTKRVALLRTVVQRARAKSDTEFQLCRAELAECIARHDRLEALRGEIDDLGRTQQQPGVIARFMLKPDFIEQLRIRRQQLEDGITPEQTDLAQVPQADNCDKGCAIDGKSKNDKLTKKGVGNKRRS